jgi:hypothetical protein
VPSQEISLQSYSARQKIRSITALRLRLRLRDAHLDLPLLVAQAMHAMFAHQLHVRRTIALLPRRTPSQAPGDNTPAISLASTIR